MALKRNKILFFIGLYAFIVMNALPARAQTLSTSTAKISLYSSTPIEDIRALAEDAKSVLVPGNRQIAFQVQIRSFQFEKKMMQEHFNENYMESDKFPQARFAGTITENIDLSKDGMYEVHAKGTLTVHGVEQPRTIAGKLQVKDGNVHLSTAFKVRCADHKIKIPTLVFNKIAEEIDVKVEADYQSSK